ncbi:MAG: energy transducer TonB [Polyangiales bacterium]
MIEALPRSFTISTAVHACVVALGLVVASKASPGAAVRTVTTPSSVMEIAMEVEQPPAPPPPAPPPPPPPPSVVAPPPPPAARPSRARAARRQRARAFRARAHAVRACGRPRRPRPPRRRRCSRARGSPPWPRPPRVELRGPAAIAPGALGAGHRRGRDGAAAGSVVRRGELPRGVTARVRRHRNYPAIAQEMGLEGTVEVRVVIAPDGSFAAPPTIDESCGHEILDDEALRIVRRAAPFPPLVGRSDRVTLRVPVHFHLDV